MAELLTEAQADIAAAKRLALSRVALTTEKAVALAKSLTPRHPAASAAAKAFDALSAQEAPKERSALTEFLNAVKREEEAFWNAFSGEVYEGVEIVRRWL